jgi:hypothetical protein
MFRGRASSWNLRDTHMADTLDALARTCAPGARGQGGGVGAQLPPRRRARHRDGRGGELNLGQLARERHGDDAVLVGFTTHAGTVTAAHDWGDPAQRMRVNPSLPGSIERRCTTRGGGGASCRCAAASRRRARAPRSSEPLLERAIGVIYRPRTERQSHYFHARVGGSSTLYHFDETRAVVPLDRRIVAYYGNPLSKRMGVLGEYPEQEMLAQARPRGGGVERGRPRAPRAAGAAPHRHRGAGRAGQGRQVPPRETRDDREGVRVGAEPERAAVPRRPGGKSTLEEELPCC